MGRSQRWERTLVLWGSRGVLEAVGSGSEVEVSQDECGHGFEDGDGAGDDAGIVASLLGHAADGAGWFEGDAQDDAFAVGDAALDSVGGRADAGVQGSVCSGVEIKAGAGCVLEGVADGDADDGADAHHGVGEQVFGFVEDGFAEAGGAAVDPEFDDAAAGVSLLFASE